MEIQLRHCPSFGVARVLLAPNEVIKAEAGAMMAHSYGLQLEARMEGGIMKGLKRGILGGESLFTSTFTAPPQGGWVDLAAKLPGDLRVLELDGSCGWLIERGNWLANEAGVTIDAKWAGFRSLFGGEGGFMVHAAGVGKVIVASYGAVESWPLQAGQTVVVDTTHILAFADTVSYQLVKATSGGLIQSAKSGEGFVFQITGPGDILVQSRSQRQLLTWIATGIGGRE
ncbi:MAG: TIGR00266 family protein [Acidimicrobiales bacterium]|nr:TIGR00266 family protein [Acidimicrobiales bacterium]